MADERGREAASLRVAEEPLGQLPDDRGRANDGAVDSEPVQFPPRN